MGTTRLRGAALLTALSLVAAACSGAPDTAGDDVELAIEDAPGGADPGAVEAPADTSTGAPTGAPAGSEAATEVSTEAEGGGSVTAEGGDSPSDGGAVAGEGGDTSGSDDSGSGSQTTGGSQDGATGGGGTSTDSGGSAPPTVTGPYSADRARIGITDDEIYICGHAALIFADAFDIRPEDLNVYFEMVNREQGGVHGRKVRIDWKDDAYNPNQAVTAAQTCVNRDPFMLIGGIGFDQIPAVRSNVENKWKLPYLHHIAVEPQGNPTYSFSFLPTVQRMGRGFGEYIAARHAGKKVGIISRESENWGPGHAAAVAYLKSKGVEIVGDYETRKDQHAYQQELFQLQQAGAEVVWVWESALAAAEVIQQANQQNFTPTWVVFPFQLTLDVATPRSDVEGVAAWPSYAPGGYGGSDPVGHSKDIELFERAYAKYRPNTEPNDLLYITWAGHKGLHQLLLDCGPECDRNRIHALIESGYKPTPKSHPIWRPNCGVDFSRSDTFGHHYGGFRFYAQQAYDHNGQTVFRTTQYCWERFS